MPIADWRSNTAYKNLENVPFRGIAWEYLRRNKQYARTFRQAMSVSSADPADASARRWGLRFPGRPGSARDD